MSSPQSRNRLRTAHPPDATARKRAAASAPTTSIDRRRQLLRFAVVTVVAVTAFSLMGWSVLRDTDGGSDEATTSGGVGSSLAAVSGLGVAQTPPWPVPADTRTRATKAGLPLGAMGTAEHYHAHLDVLVNGQPIPVPANIGVDQTTGTMTYLHTHTPDGLLHIEAGTSGQLFTLGQLFTQWNVRLSAAQLGSLRTGDGNALRLLVDGKPVTGNPALARLRPHQQLTLVFGPPEQKVNVPDSYDFAPGE